MDMADDGGQPLYSWYDFHCAAREIITQIKAEGTTITGVVAIPRGGLALGLVISHALCVPLYIATEPEPWMPTTILACDDNTVTGGSLAPFAHRGMPCAVLQQHPNAPGIHPFFRAEISDELYLFPWEAESPNVADQYDVETIVAGPSEAQ